MHEISHTCMALIAEAVLVMAPRILAMMTVSAVMGCVLQLVTAGLKLVMGEFCDGTCDVFIEPPHDPPPDD